MYVMPFYYMGLGRLVTGEFCGFWWSICKYWSSGSIAVTLEYCSEFWLFIYKLFTGSLTANYW
ncbi:hypothetical protein ES332_D11G355400v1 [Gossypium tomentosum]|uniref:Uncharacterized protein n=1 Tax=Gossypium tomentosum TaxID=34277 RepID=A0A5D2IXR5_GOSTO|nr:hypothetical protein ES332_D11G355400v1 [Gossypium tomentosum]